MLKVINKKGDLLDIHSWLMVKHGIYPIFLVQGCNAQGVMGSGVALQVKHKIPESYRSYKSLCNSLPVCERLGRYTVSGFGSGKYMVNAITQENYGTDGKRYTSYDAVSEVFRELAVYVGKEEVVMAIPKKFASDRGGACWKAVKQIIKSELKDTNVILYVVEYDQ